MLLQSVLPQKLRSRPRSRNIQLNYNKIQLIQPRITPKMPLRRETSMTATLVATNVRRRLNHHMLTQMSSQKVSFLKRPRGSSLRREHRPNLNMHILIRSRYFEECHKFLPLFDPAYDTYEELRKRSPFCVTVICMVAARVWDGGNPPSKTYVDCQREARDIAKNSMFLQMTRKEAVQALVGATPTPHAFTYTFSFFSQLSRTILGS